MESSNAVPTRIHEPHVERARGPYETTVTNVGRFATSVVTLPAETNRTRAIKNAHAYLVESEPGTEAHVHRWTKGVTTAHAGDPAPEQLEYHAHVDDDRTIHVRHDRTTA